MFPAHRVIIAMLSLWAGNMNEHRHFTHTLMVTQPSTSGFKSLHALGEQLNASGRAGKSGYLSVLLITMHEPRVRRCFLPALTQLYNRCLWDKKLF